MFKFIQNNNIHRWDHWKNINMGVDKDAWDAIRIKTQSLLAQVLSFWDN